MDAQVQKTAKILKSAFAAAIVVYFALTIVLEQFVLNESSAGFVYEPSSDEAQMFLVIFAFLGLGSLAMQFVLPTLLTKQVKSGSSELSAVVVRMACCESIAVFGLLLFLLNGQSTYAWFFMAIAMLTLLFGDKRSQTL